MLTTPSPLGSGDGFAETVGNLQQIQDVDSPIGIDVNGTSGAFEVDFAVEVGEHDGFRDAALFPLSETGVADSGSVMVCACPLRL